MAGHSFNTPTSTTSRVSTIATTSPPTIPSFTCPPHSPRRPPPTPLSPSPFFRNSSSPACCFPFSSPRNPSLPLFWPRPSPSSPSTKSVPRSTFSGTWSSCRSICRPRRSSRNHDLVLPCSRRGSARKAYGFGTDGGWSFWARVRLWGQEEGSGVLA